MPAAALLPVFLQLLPLLQVAIPEFITFLGGLKSAAQQAGEWTDAEEAAFRAALLAKTGDPAYLPDA